MERLLVAFGVSDAIVGDLLEQRASRSDIWFWQQSLAAIASAIGGAVVTEPWAAVRAIGIGNGILFAGAWLSLRVYVWATFAIPFPHTWVTNPYFVLAWHSYEVPLQILWCVTACVTGRAMMRVDRCRRLVFAIIGVVAQAPVLVWFAWPAIAAALRNNHPPTPPRFEIAFVVDVLMVMLVMPMCTIRAALKGCATRGRPTTEA